MRPLTIIAALGTAGGVLAACAAPAVSTGAPVAGQSVAQTSAPPPAAVRPPPDTPDQAPQGMRIILKLKDPNARVDSPDMLARLGSISASELTYVRPMSGNAHVLILTTAPGMSYDEALGLLRSSRLVDYVEPDAVRHAQ